MNKEQIKALSWPDNQLLPAIVQHAISGKVLMQGYMSPAALEHTFQSGQVTFYSRSKQRLWTKGESSGNTLQLVSIASDCDSDSILVLALPQGPTCHVGTETCWHDNSANSPQLAFLHDLEQVIKSREGSDPASSYTASLFAKGVKRIAQKVGEEGVESALAAMAGDTEELANEAADLIFHLLVLLRSQKLELNDVIKVLQQRHR
ncbi:MAG: bifunctional phosphoribosyl-AMP cyclohydrolase/phosphoribosyl-ATP diphosphatase [Rheinheimera sp.]|uniref:bifunctional phosphoribosyl-AMP cyclohydrolase/phosphoribosyl-ATP diphosphatase HisIE n=1 Tax=Arsukibacterium sp. UBA3155 TaxID=1946058 RepID=UPI000C9026F6|nr:bifunctional phosphoribosyl-AMP cyclohydrolase/phosphoribosyl-ATP diphosphatase HisIE [Arsukibacterium sp. UBA3155]MAD76192.1 bifunctional phosphoribosyl-AMP cyclohydrolase/phosphoribosyl-ATP diphosphatase [Rheinheimera sp.]|tara:strand:- start:67968 stop:68582 length:615 start_codon:yes stop_codon:yes gene_type:complete